MDAARLILIIPSHREGTLWEIATLRERGYIEKTIFIMPPEMDFHGAKYSADWQKTVAAAREYDVEFPNHIAAGVLFRLSPDGDFEGFAPFAHEEVFKGVRSGSYASSGDAGSSDGGIDTAGGDVPLGADGVDSGSDGGGLAGDGGDGGGDGGGGDGGNGGARLTSW